MVRYWMNRAPQPQVIMSKFMIVIIILVLWDASIVLRVASASNVDPPPTIPGFMRPKIYLFGDSNTEYSFNASGGWGASVANHFDRRADMVLRGYAGYNSRMALDTMHNAFHMPGCAGSVAAVTVSFGANDACLPDRACFFRHIPIHDYKTNLHSIIAFLRGRWPSVKILLITPPPVIEELLLKNPSRNDTSGLLDRTNENSGMYAKACVEVAQEDGTVGAINLWEKIQEFPDWKDYLYLYDGLHLGPKGSLVLFKQVIRKFKELGISKETMLSDA